jgi:uncharacterized metal-binding protein
LFPCSGGSNVGQIANAAAVKLTQEGKGRMYCLAGLGGDVSGIVESTKSAQVRVVIDGCPVGCARATLRRLGLEPEVALVVTELGIEKNKNFNLSTEDIERTSGAIAQGLAGRSANQPACS